MHGISDIDGMSDIIDADHESFVDNKKLAHQRPMIIFKHKEDDPVKLASIVTKIDNASNLGENMHIPDNENTVAWQVVQIQCIHGTSMSADCQVVGGFVNLHIINRHHRQIVADILPALTQVKAKISAQVAADKEVIGV